MAGDGGRFRAMRAVAQLDIVLRAEGPALVKGPDAMSPALPDMVFVRYPTPWGDAPFLPGSSLKGVLRSGSEAMLRGLGTPMCDPINGQCKGARCACCLLFGSVQGAGHLLVEDFLPWSPDDDDATRNRRVALAERRRVVRSGVSIDRETGAAASGRLFDYEVLVDATFWGRMVVRNPEPWHLSVVGASLSLLDQGVLRVGSGTTRGLGRFRIAEQGLTVRGVDAPTVHDLCAGGPFPEPSRAGVWFVATSNPDADVVGWLARRLAGHLDEIPSGVAT